MTNDGWTNDGWQQYTDDIERYNPQYQEQFDEVFQSNEYHTVSRETEELWQELTKQTKAEEL